MRPSERENIGPSQRQLKVGEEIRHALSLVISRDMPIESVCNGHMITITEVQMSPDLKHAKAFVMTFAGKDLDLVVKDLNMHSAHYRYHVAKHIRLKFMPKIIFKQDMTYLRAQHMEDLFRNIQLDHENKTDNN
jgi:ribosome-binding factor A